MKTPRLTYVVCIFILMLGALEGRQTINAQGTATTSMGTRAAGDVRRLNLFSPVIGQYSRVIYWIDGKYIEDSLFTSANFLSRISNTRPIIDIQFHDALAAASNLLKNNEDIRILEFSFLPEINSYQVHLSINQRSLMQFCRAWASLQNISSRADYCSNDRGSDQNPMTLETEIASYKVIYSQPTLDFWDDLYNFKKESHPSGDGMVMSFVQNAKLHQRADRLSAPQPDLPCTHRLTGRIMPEDGKRIATAIGTLAARFELSRLNGIDTGGLFFCLDSPGGALAEALQITRAILQNGIPTKLEPGASCLSACSWIFMAGNIRTEEGLRHAWRVLSPSATIGFHSLSFKPDRNHVYSAEQINEAMRTGMGAAVEIQGIFNSVGNFLDGTPALRDSLMRRVVRTPIEENYLIKTVDDAGRWGIWIDLPQRTSFTADDFHRACHNKILWGEDFTANSHLVRFNVHKEENTDGTITLHLEGSQQVRHKCSFSGVVERQEGVFELQSETSDLSPILFLHPGTRIDTLQ
ncbi:MAG: hypothetical protein JJU24_12105 [Natronohydrobacter sp.]|nr:hypothetical protein [Natronohydrobacter sp.]